MTMRISLHKGDITQVDTDAIVNAANNSLLGGGGVDGAIHCKAGKELLDYNRNLGGCPTGKAKLSPGFKLPAKYIIHTVGPVWRGGNSNEDELLRSSYYESMKLAANNNIRSIAFPSISTGAYGFPLERATRIAINTVIEALKEFPSIEKTLFVCFDERTLEVYRKVLSTIHA